MSLKRIFSVFKPNQKGLGKVLGHLEADIMEIVWKMEEASVRDVYETLRMERKIAYTTVMTIMGHLSDKNILSKSKRGNAFVYKPTCTKEEFTDSFVGSVVEGLMEDFVQPAFSHFLDKLKDADKSKIEELRRILDQHDEDSKKQI